MEHPGGSRATIQNTILEKDSKCEKLGWKAAKENGEIVWTIRFISIRSCKSYRRYPTWILKPSHDFTCRWTQAWNINKRFTEITERELEITRREWLMRSNGLIPNDALQKRTVERGLTEFSTSGKWREVREGERDRKSSIQMYNEPFGRSFAYLPTLFSHFFALLYLLPT